MRKIYLIGTLLAFTVIGLGTLESYPTGAPAGRTGSPGDGGATCITSGCHSGTTSDVSNVITTNIPTEGYTPGTTYTITVTMASSGKKGFQVSPQKVDGTLVGTLTAGTGSQLVSNKYVTHTSFKSANPAIWTFSWTAPASGTGAVDFYGAFAINTSAVQKQKYTVNEKTATGVNENAYISQLSLYPNPIVNKTMNLGFEMKKAGDLKISLIDMTGRDVFTFEEAYHNAGMKDFNFNLPELNRGMYFVQIKTNDLSLSKKVLLNN
ncbi:MAG: choice-of-anchor V domain-containing protein [Bacteroidia bacterium]